MADDMGAVGPISYLIVEFPGNKMTGEGFVTLLDLVDRGVIRILDLMFVRPTPMARCERSSSRTSITTDGSTSLSSQVRRRVSWSRAISPRRRR